MTGRVRIAVAGAGLIGDIPVGERTQHLCPVGEARLEQFDRLRVGALLRTEDGGGPAGVFRAPDGTMP